MHACDRFGIALPRAASSAFVSPRYLESAEWLADLRSRGSAAADGLPSKSGGPPVGLYHGTTRRDSVLKQIRKETKKVVTTIRMARPEVAASVVQYSAIKALEHYVADILLAGGQ